MRNKILIFQGQITSPFFLNEINFIKKFYDIEGIFFYDKNCQRDLNNIIQKNKLDNNVCYNITLHLSDYIKAFFAPKPVELYKELKSIMWKKHFFHKSLYILYYFVYAFKTYNILKVKNISKKSLCLYSFWLSRNAYAMYYLNEKLFEGKAFMCSRAHGYDLYEDRNKLNYLPFRQLFAEKINLLSFISNDGLSYFIRKYDVKNDAEVHYLGTFNQYQIQKKIKEKNDICILSCSSIIEVKRLDLIINLLKRLDGMKIKWVHFGSGSLSDEIKNLAKEKLSNTSIRFDFKGHLDNNQVLIEMDNIDADFFLSMSDSEGLPVSMMEALSYGIPIVSRDVGGIGEIVNDKTGFFYDVNQEVTSLKKFFEIRVNSPEKYFEISQNCIAFWKEFFDGAKNYEDFFGNRLKYLSSLSNE